jgi:hypothetical protein
MQDSEARHAESGLHVAPVALGESVTRLKDSRSFSAF